MFNRLIVLTLSAAVLSACVTTTESSLTRKKSPEKAVENYTKLGLGYLQKERFDVAKQRLDRALEIDPDSAQANDAMGIYYLTQGEVELAEEYYQKAIDSDSDYLEARHHYAQLLMQQKRYDDACDELEDVVEDVDYQQRGRALQDLGKCYYSKGENDKAIAIYKKALRGRNFNASVLLNLSTVLFEQKSYKESWNYFLRLDDLVERKQTQHTAYSLWLGIKLANIQGDAKRSGRYARELTQKHKDSVEYQLYKKSF